MSGETTMYAHHHPLAIACEPDSHKEDQLLAEHNINRRLITDQTIRESRILARVEAVRFGHLVRKPGVPACLIVFEFRFAPFDTRFRQASVDIQFEPVDEDAHEDVRIEALSPERLVGDASETRVRHVLEGSLALGVRAGVVSATPLSVSARREEERSVRGSMRVLGTGVDTPRARFTLEENAATRAGIPDAFVAAVLLEHRGPFRFDVVVKVAVARGDAVRFAIASWFSRREVNTLVVDDEVDFGQLPSALDVDPNIFTFSR